MTQVAEKTSVEFAKEGRHARLLTALATLLFRYDPIQISYGTNCEEYAPEAQRILVRLGDCYRPEDATVVVFQELVRSFGAEAVGSIDEYGRVAGEAWELVQSSGLGR